MKRQHGLTLVELMVVLAGMTLLLTAVLRYTSHTRSSLLRQEVTAELLNRSTRLSANLRTNLGGARLLLADYGGIPDFSAYRNWVRAGIQTAPQPAAFSLPPRVSNARSADLNPTSPSSQALWGNELLYVAMLKPLSFTVRTGTSQTDTSFSASVDRFQFAYTYPTLAPLGRGGIGEALRLAEWRSQPYVLYSSLSELPAARMLTVCARLVQEGYTWALDLDRISEPAQAWYRVNSTPPHLEAEPNGPPPPLQAYWAFVDEYDLVADYHPRPGLDRGRIQRAKGSQIQSGPADLVLAFNTVDPEVHPHLKVKGLQGPGRRLRVPAHALPDRNGALPGFPGGFEVAILGRPNAREVVVRHVLMAVAAVDPSGGDPTRLAYEGVDLVAVKNDY